MHWEALESAWCTEASRSLVALADANRADVLYAAAFHLFYADGAKILSPAFAVNAESAVRIHAWGSTRYVPPEWRWDVVDDASHAMAGAYERLTRDVRWPDDTVVAEHDLAIARVCRTLTTRARRGELHPSLPPGFVVAILDGQRGEAEMRALVRSSVEPQVLATLPELAALA